MRKDILVARPGKDGKTFWVKIGSSIESEKGQTLFFDALPLTDKDGRCSAIVREPKPRLEQPSASMQVRVPVARDMDDEIPF